MFLNRDLWVHYTTFILIEDKYFFISSRLAAVAEQGLELPV